MTYEFFTNDQCDGTPESSETVSVGTESSSTGALPAGDYSFLVSYSGDANHAGATADCEPFHVAKADTSTATEVHLDGNHTDVTGETRPLGSAFHDKASVTTTNNAFTITGTVTYEFFTNDTCDGSPVGSEAVSVGSESSSTGAAGGRQLLLQGHLQRRLELQRLGRERLRALPRRQGRHARPRPRCTWTATTPT